MSRMALLVFLLALMAGAMLGLYVGWVVMPARVAQARLDLLRSEDQIDYVWMVAGAFDQELDVETARNRLKSLGVDPEQSIAAAAQQLDRWPEADRRRLAALAAALGSTLPPALESYRP